jgi:hypothetical protein
MGAIAALIFRAKPAVVGAVAFAALACANNPIQPEPTLTFPAVQQRVPVLDGFLPNLELTDVVAKHARRTPDMRTLVDVQIAAMTAHVRRKVGSVPARPEHAMAPGYGGERKRLARNALSLLPYLDIDSGETELSRVAAGALATALGDDAEYVTHVPDQATSFDFSAEVRDGVGVLRLRQLTDDVAQRVFAALNQWASTTPPPRAILLDLSRADLSKAAATSKLFNVFAPGQIAFRLEYRDEESGRLEQSVWRSKADWESPIVAGAPLFVWLSRSAPALVEAAVTELREHRQIVVIGDKTTGSARFPTWFALSGNAWFGFTIADVLDARGRSLRGRPVYPDACPVEGELVDVEPAEASFEARCAGRGGALELDVAVRYVAKTP